MRLFRKHVLVTVQSKFEGCSSLLRGISKFEHTGTSWNTIHDENACAEADPEVLAGHAWDGVISRHTNAPLVEVCRREAIPLVDLNDTAVHPGTPKIRPDNHAVGCIAAEHLLELGFRSFCFAGYGNQLWAQERRDGYIGALKAAGHACSVFETDLPALPTPNWDTERRMELAKWLVHVSPPTAIFACCDRQALQILAAAREDGFLVPEDLAVLGVNNDAVRCELAHPPLSSIALDTVKTGYEAAAALEALTEHRSVRCAELLIPPLGVVVRRSTDIIAIKEKNVSLALAYIREHACRGLKVEEILPHAHMSRSKLERAFRRTIGRSPQEEIRRVQVARIRQMLADTDLPLKQIAEFTGFEYVEYLSVVFKRICGVTPGAYRSKLKHGNVPAVHAYWTKPAASGQVRVAINPAG